MILKKISDNGSLQDYQATEVWCSASSAVGYASGVTYIASTTGTIFAVDYTSVTQYSQNKSPDVSSYRLYTTIDPKQGSQDSNFESIVPVSSVCTHLFVTKDGAETQELFLTLHDSRKLFRTKIPVPSSSNFSTGEVYQLAECEGPITAASIDPTRHLVATACIPTFPKRPSSTTPASLVSIWDSASGACIAWCRVTPPLPRRHTTTQSNPHYDDDHPAHAAPIAHLTPQSPGEAVSQLKLACPDVLLIARGSNEVCVYYIIPQSRNLSLAHMLMPGAALSLSPQLYSANLESGPVDSSLTTRSCSAISAVEYYTCSTPLGKQINVLAVGDKIGRIAIFVYAKDPHACVAVNSQSEDRGEWQLWCTCEQVPDHNIVHLCLVGKGRGLVVAAASNTDAFSSVLTYHLPSDTRVKQGEPCVLRAVSHKAVAGWPIMCSVVHNVVHAVQDDWISSDSSDACVCVCTCSQTPVHVQVDVPHGGLVDYHEHTSEHATPPTRLVSSQYHATDAGYSSQLDAASPELSMETQPPPAVPSETKLTEAHGSGINHKQQMSLPRQTHPLSLPPKSPTISDSDSCISNTDVAPHPQALHTSLLGRMVVDSLADVPRSRQGAALDLQSPVVSSVQGTTAHPNAHQAWLKAPTLPPEHAAAARGIQYMPSQILVRTPRAPKDSIGLGQVRYPSLSPDLKQPRLDLGHSIPPNNGQTCQPDIQGSSQSSPQCIARPSLGREGAGNAFVVNDQPSRVAPTRSPKHIPIPQPRERLASGGVPQSYYREVRGWQGASHQAGSPGNSGERASEQYGRGRNGANGGGLRTGARSGSENGQGSAETRQGGMDKENWVQQGVGMGQEHGKFLDKVEQQRVGQQAEQYRVQQSSQKSAVQEWFVEQEQGQYQWEQRQQRAKLAQQSQQQRVQESLHRLYNTQLQSAQTGQGNQLEGVQKVGGAGGMQMGVGRKGLQANVGNIAERKDGGLRNSSATYNQQQARDNATKNASSKKQFGQTTGKWVAQPPGEAASKLPTKNQGDNVQPTNSSVPRGEFAVPVLNSTARQLHQMAVLANQECSMEDMVAAHPNLASTLAAGEQVMAARATNVDRKAVEYDVVSIDSADVEDTAPKAKKQLHPGWVATSSLRPALHDLWCQEWCAPEVLPFPVFTIKGDGGAGGGSTGLGHSTDDVDKGGDGLMFVLPEQERIVMEWESGVGGQDAVALEALESLV